MLGQPIILQHVHERRLPGIIETLHQQDAHIVRGCSHQPEGGECHPAASTGAHQEQDLCILVVQAQPVQGTVEPVR